VIYRLTLHPLAKYPGPFLGCITDFYSVWQAWKGTRHLDFHNLHLKYGDIVRYGPNSISINTNTALHEIYGFKANVRKAHFYSVFPAQKGAWSTHSAIDKGLHARKRRVLSQAFSDNAMRGLQPHILGIIRTFTDAIGDVKHKSKDVLSGSWSTPKNMALWANYMSYDVLGDICYGQSFDTLEREDNRFAVELVGESSKFHYLNAQMPFLKKLGLDRVLFPTMRANRQRFMGYSKARLQERMRLGTDNDRRDFFYYLLNAKDPETGVGFKTQELWGESNVLLIAGSDTTSTAFSAVFFYLLTAPEELKRLQKEIRSTFSSVEDIVSGTQLTSCKYLRACIDEAMRLAPPVPALLPREVLQGGMIIDGHSFPAGTVVGVPAYAIHHKEEYYPDPFYFNPSRWLADEVSTGEHNLAKSAFCPFSIGPRGCIGKGVAYLELSVALARTVWLYDFRASPGYEEKGAASDGSYELQDIFVAKKDGPVVEFKRRVEGDVPL
jgi:cytochrome P450